MAHSTQVMATQTWTVNLKDADIRAFIRQISDMTGYTMVIDPRVKGKVTIVSNASMDKDAVYQMFLSVLSVHGYAAIKAGDVIKVIQQNAIKQQGGNTESDEDGEQVVTTVLQIENTAAMDLVPILRPMIAKYGHLAGVKSANALIISDHAANIDRIREIIRSLDSAGAEELEVIQLKEAWVGDVVIMLESLDPKKVSKGKSDNNNIGGSIRVVADERSNRLILKGEKTSRERVRKLIKKLDQPSNVISSAQVIRLQHADAKKLADLLKALMSDSIEPASKGGKPQSKASIHADEDLNALVVRAEPSIMGEIKNIIHELDVRRAQVLIEAAIVEVSGSSNEALGIQWAMADLDGNSGPAFGTNFSNAGQSLSGLVGGLAAGTPALAEGATLALGKEVNGAVTFGAVIQALEAASNTNLLSTPSIMTLDNQEAEIIVGQNVPFRTGTESSSSTSNPFTTITREDVGVTLRVTPHIHEGKLLRLEVEQTSESVAEEAVSGQADLITNKRSIKTVILAEDGETIVLGGLMKDDFTTSESKVPWLGDIPLIGALFRSQKESRIKRNLMVFLKPTIVLNKVDAKKVTNKQFNGLKEFTLSPWIGEGKEEEALERLFHP
jgi:general secretion pathway protein D